MDFLIRLYGWVSVTKVHVSRSHRCNLVICDVWNPLCVTSVRPMFGHNTYCAVCEALAPLVRLRAGYFGCVSADQSELRPGAEALALIGWEVLLLSGRALAFSRRGAAASEAFGVWRSGDPGTS